MLCIHQQDSDVLKKSKLKLKQTAEQFENSAIWSQKIISIQNFSLTEQEADLQFLKYHDFPSYHVKHFYDFLYLCGLG